MYIFSTDMNHKLGFRPLQNQETVFFFYNSNTHSPLIWVFVLHIKKALFIKFNVAYLKSFLGVYNGPWILRMLMSLLHVLKLTVCLKHNLLMYHISENRKVYYDMFLFYYIVCTVAIYCLLFFLWLVSPYMFAFK